MKINRKVQAQIQGMFLIADIDVFLENGFIKVAEAKVSQLTFKHIKQKINQVLIFFS
jgi:hypothetical protein